jgi:hypothetical protein
MSRAIVIGAVVVVVVACKPSATAPSPASASDADTSADASVSDAAVGETATDAATEDEGGAAAAADTGSPPPPLAKGAAWSVVRWDMARADAAAAFEKAGVKAENKNDPKTGAERLSVKYGPWHAVVYFRAKKPDSIVVIGERLSKDAAAAEATKMTQRAGAPSQTTRRLELRWRKKGAGATTFVVANDGGLREEYVRDGATGDVAFAKLTWGMTAAAAQQALSAAGYVANVTKPSAVGLDPCSLPNAPPDCVKKAAQPSVAFTKGDTEGTVSFDDKGLSQVVVTSSSTDGGAARKAELTKALGDPTTVESSTKMQYADDVAKIEVETTEHQPANTFSVIETFRPKK